MVLFILLVKKHWIVNSNWDSFLKVYFYIELVLNNLEEAKAASESFVTKYQKNKILIKKYMINENHLLGLFEYSEYIRKMIYTTNAIKAVNSSLKKHPIIKDVSLVKKH